ncbi:hypothetical protein HHX47_DHR3001051 [Lentinula edodes]|nr:hypothetical protein HHX47_DHR3001051 [Lentinula edodes]
MTESTLVPIAPAPPVALVGASTSTANYQNQKQAGTKRKRNDAQEPSGPDSGSTQSKKARDGPKKKKANRACFHCQKAHLTCDDSDPILQESPTFEVPFDSNFPFGSEAANLEYSILSAILGNPSPPQGDSTPPPTYSGWPSSDPLIASQSPTFSSTFPTSLSSNLAASPTTAYLTYQYQEPPRTSELSEVQYPPFQQSVNTPNTTPQPLQSRYSLESRAKSPPYSVFIDETSHGLLSPPHSNASPSLTPSVVRSTDSVASASICTPGSKLQSIHDRVTKPYDYTEGYHFLMKHLPIRFEKNDILRIVRALAIFRPSLIALQMPLSLDDEVFVEKCFQRSLLVRGVLPFTIHTSELSVIDAQELEKLISFSGTPTVIWRRTGEICLVAPEFCMLTEWSMEELLGKKKYIYEVK